MSHTTDGLVCGPAVICPLMLFDAWFLFIMSAAME